MMPALELGVDLNREMLEELSEAARKLKVTKQTLIKRFIRHGLDTYQTTQKVRRAG
jgi:metal-responsive CopG/Arc/MetJ family transcriptional regulator